MFLSDLFFRWRFRSFPSLIETNVGLRSLVRFDSNKGHDCPNELSVSLMGYQDFLDISDLHSKNKVWLDPWMVSEPEGFVFSNKNFSVIYNMFSTNIDDCLKRMSDDRDYYFKVCLDGVLCGFICVNEISRASLCSAQLGYWVSRDYAGRNIIPVALAMVVDFCFEFLLLHRVEINICVDNFPSLRVVEKLGFRFEGTRQKYIFVNGKWVDHVSFALTVEDLCCGGVLAKLEDGCTCFE